MHAWATKGPMSHNTKCEPVVWTACCIYVVACAYRLARFNVGTLRTSHPSTSHDFPASRPDAAGPHKPTPGFRRFYIARSKFFSGAPAPVGAYLAIAPIILFFNGARIPVPDIFHLQSSEAEVCLVMIVVAVCMVSTVPTISAKVLMRDPKTESHLRNRSYTTMAAKGAALAVTLAITTRCRQREIIFQEFKSDIVPPLLNRYPWQALLALEVAAIVSIPLGPVIYHFIAHDA
eukprot:c8421_g1_i2.p1 GENE.c8421_g1_i2~~c8421_g1_i2.p1  ORF type:complete len:233 (-),score=23.08 c8421_g1_i2:56-754(-)